MEKTIKKFLEFNGKSICFLLKDGTYWVALKPICEALGVNWMRQFTNLKEHEILGPAHATQPMQIDGVQTRDYVSLPETLVYGWLMTINSTSPGLVKYQWECYKILYNYFHGTITERLTALRVETEAEIKFREAVKTLKESEVYKAVQQAKVSVGDSKKLLQQLDEELRSSQMELFPQLN